ncbi:hypothetical protein MC885_001267, partial [Smutsia gigantea]
RLMSVNYLGSVYPSRAVITTMKERRVGRIVFVSSQAGQLGLFGFTAYSSSKFAIRGLAEALQMEVKPYNVYVTVAYPPDTDTPGFAEENKTKPLETRLISETTSVCKPEQVAKQIVKDAIQGNFNSSIGSDGYMLSSLTCGMAPVTSITEGLQQVVTMGLFRTIALFYLGSFDSIVRRCMMQRARSEKCVLCGHLGSNWKCDVRTGNQSVKENEEKREKIKPSPTTSFSPPLAAPHTARASRARHRRPGRVLPSFIKQLFGKCLCRSEFNQKRIPAPRARRVPRPATPSRRGGGVKRSRGQRSMPVPARACHHGRSRLILTIIINNVPHEIKIQKEFE